MAHPMKDVIVVIPGIMGSVLERDGDEIWAPSGGAIWNFLKSRSRSLRSLALTADDDGSDDDLGDGVTATRLMPDIHLVPGLWSIDGYGQIKDTLHASFELRTGHNYFEFPYDWRRHNGVHGRRLRQLSHRWLQDWRAESGNDGAKLILVGHSMGGLVARSFLELEGGWADTRMLITFGTPYSGSLNSLNFIANGFSKGFGPAELDLSELLRSLTSVYQLLPTFACVDGAGDELVVPTDPAATVPHLDLDRASDALAFHTAMNDAAAANGGGIIHPIVGIRQPTLQRAVVRNDELWVSSDWDPTKADSSYGGDGTVPRRSAIPPEMYADPRGAKYSAIGHGSLQNDDDNLTHLEGILTERAYFVPELNASAAKYLALDIDDYFHVDEDIAARVSSSELGATFQITVANTATGATAATRTFDNFNGEALMTVAVPDLAEGTYRVTVSATSVAGVPPVSRLVVVWA